jgi:hypothetical protein
MQRCVAAALLSCVFVLHSSPASAQSRSANERARVSFTSVHQYVAGDAIPKQLSVPPNIVVSSIYVPMLESMLRRSPTFRRQCMRIAAERSLTVRIEIALPNSGYDARATTRITRHEQNQLRAVVQIKFKDVEELIAHEFEHIIEQLDGVDLAAHAARGQTGVKEVGRGPGVFETTRAKRAGEKVLSELGS